MILHKDRDREGLIEWINTYKGEDHRIGTTNGIFDILHPGHLNSLKHAAEGVDFLFVGLNSDASVKRQGKGVERPVQDEMSRAIVLDAIRWVDFVVIFDEDTPCGLLEIIQPDVHTKGGDYDIEKLPETPVVEFHGGVVKTFPLLEGYSTTRIVESIIDAYCNLIGLTIRPRQTKEVNEDDH